MTQKYDVIVIGGGHNGLVNAAYLIGLGFDQAKQPGAQLPQMLLEWLLPGFGGKAITMYQESQFSAQTTVKNMYLNENDDVAVPVYVANQGLPAAPGTPFPFSTVTDTDEGGGVVSFGFLPSAAAFAAFEDATSGFVNCCTAASTSCGAAKH